MKTVELAPNCKRKTRLIFGEPLIEKEEIEEVIRTLHSGWLSTGPKVEKFEELFSNYAGSKYSCALGSCSAALHLSLLVAGVGHGDEVITTPLTFAATANAIMHVGAKPVFADVQKETLNIDPGLIERKVTKKTKAIIPVHFAGRPCDLKRITAIARKHGLIVIEDASHALGAEYEGRKIGNISDLTCFSFYANKNITTGEGGMVTTNNSKWHRKIKVLSSNGIDYNAWQRYNENGLKDYKIVSEGFKYNMTDLQAAIGIHQLNKLERFLKRREEIWRKYDAAFKDLPVSRPLFAGQGVRHARHLYTLIIDTDKIKISRDEFRRRLLRENICTGVHFISLHLFPYYRNRFGFKKGDFSSAEYISKRIVSLPLTAKLNAKDVNDVISAVIYNLKS